MVFKEVVLQAWPSPSRGTTREPRCEAVSQSAVAVSLRRGAKLDLGLSKLLAVVAHTLPKDPSIFIVHRPQSRDTGPPFRPPVCTM